MELVPTVYLYYVPSPYFERKFLMCEELFTRKLCNIKQYAYFAKFQTQLIHPFSPNSKKPTNIDKSTCVWVFYRFLI